MFIAARRKLISKIIGIITEVVDDRQSQLTVVVEGLGLCISLFRMHMASAAAVKIAASSRAIRGNSQRWQGRRGGRLLLCNFLPTAYGGILSKRDHQSDHLFFKYAHAACNFSARKMAGDSTSGAASGKYARAFEVTGYKSLITGASRGAGKSFLHKHGHSRREVKQQLRDLSFAAERTPCTSQSLLSCKPAHVITAKLLVSRVVRSSLLKKSCSAVDKNAGHGLKIFGSKTNSSCA